MSRFVEKYVFSSGKEYVCDGLPRRDCIIVGFAISCRLKLALNVVHDEH